MIKSVDHVVILVNELAAAMADYAALGFTVVPGGEHTGGATHNALVAFADGSYLELIAFKRPAPEHRWWEYVATGEGLITFALLPTAIEEDIAAARQRGLALEGPQPGGRFRPDGQEIKWQNGTAQTHDLPFLCADVTPRALRVPDGPAWQHPNGVMGIASLTIVVADLNASIQRYQALLGLAPQPDPPLADLEATQTTAFVMGTTTIILAEAAPGPGLLGGQIGIRGESPFALALRVPPNASTLDPLDLRLAHFARIELVVDR